MTIADPSHLSSLHVPAAVKENVGYLLARLGDISGAAFEDALEPMGLRPRHYAVLCALVEHDEVASQHAIGGCLSIDPSTMVAVADELEERGLVARRRDPADRRRYLVSLTEGGRQTHSSCRAAALHCEDELLRVLDPEERSALRAMLHKLLEDADG